MTDTSTEQRKIRVLLVDDHPMIREGIRSSMAGHERIEIVGEAGDGEAAIRAARELSPDIVLMDISMEPMNGLQATKVIGAELPEVKVLMLTMHDNREYVRTIVQFGARGYVLKDTSPAELIKAIETVHAGQLFFSAEVAEFMLEDYVKNVGGRSSRSDPVLTAREREVLSWIADGRSNKEIAERLEISVRTVETHRGRIMQKLNIHSTAGLTKYAITHDIVQLH